MANQGGLRLQHQLLRPKVTALGGLGLQKFPILMTIMVRVLEWTMLTVIVKLMMLVVATILTNFF